MQYDMLAEFVTCFRELDLSSDDIEDVLTECRIAVAEEDGLGARVQYSNDSDSEVSSNDGLSEQEERHQVDDEVVDQKVEEHINDLAISNVCYQPFHDKQSPPRCDVKSVASSSVSEIEVKKRVKQSLNKQRKTLAQRRLKKGEASFVNKKRRELRDVVNSSKDIDFF